MLILHVTSWWFCLYLLKIHHFTYTFSHAHTQAHTHKHTCTISIQEEWRQPGTGACLRWAEESLCFFLNLRSLLEILHTRQKKNVRKNWYSRIWRKRFEHIKLPAKLLDYFLRCNKSNINQSYLCTKRIDFQMAFVASCSLWGLYLCLHSGTTNQGSLSAPAAMLTVTLQKILRLAMFECFPSWFPVHWAESPSRSCEYITAWIEINQWIDMFK